MWQKKNFFFNFLSKKKKKKEGQGSCRGRGMEQFYCLIVVVITQTYSGNKPHKTVQKKRQFFCMLIFQTLQLEQIKR